MNTCPAQEELLEFLDNDLSPQDNVRIQAHVEGCARCRAELAAFRLSWQMLDKDVAPVLGPGFTDAVMSRLRQEDFPISKQLKNRLGPVLWLSLGAFMLTGILIVVGLSGRQNIEASLRPAVEPSRQEEARQALPLEAMEPENSFDELPLPEVAEPAPVMMPVPIPVAPVVLPFLAQTDSDREIIEDLDLFEKMEMVQKMELLKDIDAVEVMEEIAS